MLADSEEIVAVAALEPVEVQVDPPSREYSYPVIADPPSLGAVHDNTADALDTDDAARAEGVPGTSATAMDRVAVEEPPEFVAVIV